MNTENNQKQNTKAEKTYLWWRDSRSGRMILAGVAFYEEQFGEYRLKIDMLQALGSDSQIYLRSIGMVDGKMLFRAETVVKKAGKYAGRRVIGEGYSSLENPDEILIDLGPFERTLVLPLKEVA